MRAARLRARTFLTVVLCALICLLLITAVVITMTRVQTVVISGNTRYTSEELLSAAKLEGEMMPLLRSKTVYKRITESCPYVDEVELEKQYPSTLKVNIVETEAVFALRTRDRMLTLDAGLRVMDYVDSADGLILLTLPEIRSAVEGKRIVFVMDESEEYVNTMLDAFFTAGFVPWLTALDITDRFDIMGRAGDDAEIIFGDYKNISEKLTVASQLLDDAKKEFAKYAYIDVSVLSQASLKLEY